MLQQKECILKDNIIASKGSCLGMLEVQKFNDLL